DDPRHHATSDRGDPVARLRFYGRVGAQVLGVHYSQPEVREGAGRVHGMLLITFLAKQEALSGDHLRADVLRRFLANYLIVAEGLADAPATAEVNFLVPELEDSDAVAISPLERYGEI